MNAPATRSLFPDPLVPGVEVSCRALFEGLSVDLTTRRAASVRLGFEAPATADDFVALAAEALGCAEYAYACRNAPAWIAEAERLGARAADVALLRSALAVAAERAASPAGPVFPRTFRHR